MYFCDEHRGITRYYEILKSSVCEKYQLRQNGVCNTDVSI